MLEKGTKFTWAHKSLEAVLEGGFSGGWWIFSSTNIGGLAWTGMGWSTVIQCFATPEEAKASIVAHYGPCDEDTEADPELAAYDLIDQED